MGNQPIIITLIKRINIMTIENTQSEVKQDELSNTVSTGLIRGTDNAGNYTFLPYSPKAPVTLDANMEGYRVAKIMYKTNNKTGTIAGETSCLIVPKVTEQDVTENIEGLITHFKKYLESEQDKIIKGFHLKAVSFVEPADIGVDKIIEALEAVAISGRLNKDMIDVWFKSCVADKLAGLIASSLGTNKDDEKVILKCKVYQNSFNKMASNTTVYQPEQAKMLLDAIEKCKPDNVELINNDVTKKLADKLDKMMKPVDLGELLGF